MIFTDEYKNDLSKRLKEQREKGRECSARVVHPETETSSCLLARAIDCPYQLRELELKYPLDTCQCLYHPEKDNFKK